MKIFSGITAVAERTDKIITPIVALLISANTAFANERITLKKYRSNGETEVLIPNLLISKLAEINADKVGGQIMGAAQSDVHIFIGDGGALYLATGESFELTITGMDVAKTYELHTPESASIVRSAIVYAMQNIPATDNGISKKFEVAGIKKIALDPTNLKEIQLFTAGAFPTFTAKELKWLNRVANDIVSYDTARTAAIFGYNTILNLDINDVSNISITPNPATAIDVYFISSKEV
jgi:hypothetical protein